ncbi:MAG: PEP-CTERM sorting domain-containing protein [Leptolyngbya sp. RL_3_1]|nr:PEP-CTERM sorting domain-containing protein [Leptolyngbya sp. RL_3_1]
MTPLLRSRRFRPFLTQLLKGIGQGVAAAAIPLILGVNPASAATIYAADSFTDGVTGGVVGGGAFELYGLGYVQQGNDLFIGLNTNLPLGGFVDSTVTGGSIAWGDMFFNFAPDLSFEAALAAGSVYGVRFDAANDSGVPLGVYQVQATKSVVAENNGFLSLQAYLDRVHEAGGNPSMGAVIPLDGSYLSNTGLPQNEIATGRWLGEVDFIEDFSTVGFGPDFGFSNALGQTGDFTYGFRVDSAIMPTGSFVAHVLAECINDGLGFRGELSEIAPRPQPEDAPSGQSVPEPSGLIGMAIALGTFTILRSPR